MYLVRGKCHCTLSCSPFFVRTPKAPFIPKSPRARRADKVGHALRDRHPDCRRSPSPGNDETSEKTQLNHIEPSRTRAYIMCIDVCAGV